MSYKPQMNGIDADQWDSELPWGRDYRQLAEKEARIQKDDPQERAAFRSLIENADRAMKAELVSVVQEKRVAPSGDKHDYLSLAPHWWPDPEM